MEAIQDWAGYLLRNGYLTPGIFGPLNTLNNITQRYLLPTLSQLFEKPDLKTIAFTLVIVWLSLQILGMLVRSVLFWVRLAFRVAFWGGIVVLAFWLSQRGVDGAVEDVGYWFRLWRGELDYYKDQAQKAAQKNGYSGYGSYGGYQKPVVTTKKAWPW